MERDFTLKKYEKLLSALGESGYVFLSFEQYLTVKRLPEKFVILRHDIDKRPSQALLVAAIEKQKKANASYYFRVVKESNDPAVIRRLAGWNFEIGYHYEDMAICGGVTEDAMDHFQHWLMYFRQFAPVRTICMHGAPQSKFDGRELWKYYNYQGYGIIGEPYFDVDFSDVFYLTDTGRCWDGYKVSVRDKVPQYQDEWTAAGLVFHSTDDIISAARTGKLPKHVMMTTHPQRWLDDSVKWTYELFRQSAANVVKRLLIHTRRQKKS